MKITQDIIQKSYAGMNFQELLDYLVLEIEVRNYLITRISNIDNIHNRSDLKTETEINFRHYKIVEFCNLESCSRLISADLLAGVFMPVRFIIYQRFEENEIYIAFLKPTAFANLFDSKKMSRIAKKLEQDMNDVLEEIVF